MGKTVDVETKLNVMHRHWFHTATQTHRIYVCIIVGMGAGNGSRGHLPPPSPTHPSPQKNRKI